VTSTSDAADLVLVNGVVRPMSRLAARHEAVAVKNGRVLAVGTSREMMSLAGEVTATVDLQGRAAVPGFIETHNHPTFYGLTLTAAVDASSPPNERVSDIVERVAEAARQQEPGTWIRGYRYDDTLLSDDRHPTRHDLDPASPNHPVCLMHISGHFCVLNSAALRVVGIDARTPDPAGGVIERDESGRPTGVLAETAAFQAYAAMPAADMDTCVEALARANESYLSHGITTVHDTGLGLTGGQLEMSAYHAAIRADRFRVRVQAYLVADLLPELAEGKVPPVAPVLEGVPADRFRTAGIKMWADGSIQGLTGALEEGYACAPNRSGILISTPDELRQRIAALDAAGLQVAVHGNGDRAIQTIINGYEALGVSPAERDSRHRIEHCQMAEEEQLDAMAEAGILASFFIKHVYYWGDRHRDRFIGPARAERLDPLASAMKHGVRFALHSDTPVVPVAPLEGIWCAVRRTTRDGHTLGAEQTIDVESALRAYTAEAAYLAHEEQDKGQLTPGRLADIAVMSQDPISADPDSLKNLAIEATIVGGEIAWTAPRTDLAVRVGGKRDD
jgi:predicted amidohydrolase YtcJ